MSAPSVPEGPLPDVEPELDYDSSYYSPSDDLEDLLSRYTVSYRPEYFVKLRKSVKAVTLGGNYCFGRRGKYCTFSVKPADRQKHSFLYKLASSPADAALRLSTNKVPLIPGSDLLRIQINLEYNWRTQAREVWWKITSRWTTGATLSRKEKYRWGDNLQLWPHWNINLHMPEVEGRLGGQDADMSLDKGYCHIRVPKMVFRASLDPPFHLPPFHRQSQRPPCPEAMQNELRANHANATSRTSGLLESWPATTPATNAIQVGPLSKETKESCSQGRRFRLRPRFCLPWPMRRWGRRRRWFM